MYISVNLYGQSRRREKRLQDFQHQVDKAIPYLFAFAFGCIFTLFLTS